MNLIRCRKLWNFSSAKRLHKVMSYSEKRKVGFSAEQMFNVVHSISEYPKFVPWCTNTKVKKINERVSEAELQIGFPPIYEHYNSRITSLHPSVIHSVCTDGRLFYLLDTTWRFGPPLKKCCKNSCTLLFSIKFEFKSAFHAQLSHLFFGQVVQKMVTAFLKRAEEVYGPPSLDHFNTTPEILTHKED